MMKQVYYLVSPRGERVNRFTDLRSARKARKAAGTGYYVLITME